MAEDTKNTSAEEEGEENKVVDNPTNEDKSGAADDKDGGNKGTNDTGSNQEKTFTQTQVNKMMTKEKNQGRNAAFKELGIDPKDSKLVNMVKAMIASQKTDEQKKAEADQESLDKVNQAEQRAIMAEAKAEAMTLGVKSQFVDDVVTLALAKMTEDSDLKTIIGEFKTKYPVWFGISSEGEDDGKSKTGQKGTGSSVKTSEKEKKGEGEKSLGARLAARRKPNTNKSSYWGKR